MSEVNQDSLPTLHPDEHSMIEKFVGRKLSNDEAQLLIRDATIWASFTMWLEGRQEK